MQKLKPAEAFGNVIVHYLHVQHQDSIPHCSIPAVLQILNPAETFGDIIVDYSYVECSSACMTALAAFAAKYVGERRASATGFGKIRCVLFSFELLHDCAGCSLVTPTCCSFRC